MDNGISDMTHLLSVEVEGFKFAVEMGRDAVKFLQRLTAIFSNALKWGMIDKSWRYYKESGPTNIANLRAKHPEGFTTLKMNKSDYEAFLKFAKKYNIAFIKAPCADKNSVAVWYGLNDVQLMEYFTKMSEEKLRKEQSKKGLEKTQGNEQDSVLEKVEAEVVYEPPRTMDMSDYMYENGFMDCSQEEFDDILRETYGEQCTTLTQFIDNAMEGADPEAQKKRNAEVFEKCRIEDLSKESRAGAVTLSFEKKQFAGYDMQKQMAFFQIVKEPSRWMGIPLNRLIRKKDEFIAVVTEQSHVTINDIAFDEREPKGYRFEPQEVLDLKQISDLDRSWRDSVASERISVHTTMFISEQSEEQQRKKQKIAVEPEPGDREGYRIVGIDRSEEYDVYILNTVMSFGGYGSREEAEEAAQDLVNNGSPYNDSQYELVSLNELKKELYALREQEEKQRMVRKEQKEQSAANDIAIKMQKMQGGRKR